MKLKSIGYDAKFYQRQYGGAKMNVRDEISRIAYELYVNSGYIQGHEFENWIEAERIVLARHAGQEEEKPKEKSGTTEPVVSEEMGAAAEKKIKPRAAKITGAAKKGSRAKETAVTKKKKAANKKEKN
jgi:hypothetical protein